MKARCDCDRVEEETGARGVAGREAEGGVRVAAEEPAAGEEPQVMVMLGWGVAERRSVPNSSEETGMERMVSEEMVCGPMPG